MSKKSWYPAITLLLLLVLAAGESRAAEKIVLIKLRGSAYPEQAWPILEDRLRAELLTAGMEVVSVEIDLAEDEEIVDGLARTAAELDALAAVCVVRSGKDAVTRVWIDDQVTDKVVMSRFESRAESRAKEAGDVALRIVELLHASLIELRVMKLEGRQPKRNAPVVDRLVDEKLGVDQSRLSLTVGASALVSLQPLDPLLGLWVGLSARLPYQLRVDVDIGATPVRAAVDGVGGKAEVGLAMGRAHLVLDGPRDWFAVPSLGAGAAFVLLWADGRADEGFAGSTSLAHATAISLRLSTAFEITRWLRGHLLVGSLFTFPGLDVRFVDEAVARTGRPIIDLGVLFEW